MTPSFDFQPFGMVNTHDPIFVDGRHLNNRKFTEMVNVQNYDVDDFGKAVPRSGVTTVSPFAAHSGYTDGEVCLFVEGGVLKRLWPDETITVEHILTDDSTLRYAVVPDGIFCVSPKETGLYKNGWKSLSKEDDRRFKTLLPPGQVVNYNQGRVFVGSGRSVFYSEAYSLGMDSRKCEIPCLSPVTMVQGLENSFYISDQDGVHWCNNVDPTFEGFEKTEVSPEAALPGNSLKLDSKYFSADLGMSGYVAVWFSKRGFCVGSDQGKVVNISLEKLSPPQGAEVHLSFRKLHGFYQLLASIRGATTADNPYSGKNITLTTTQL